MNKRPISITLIAWYLIIASLFGMIMLLTTLHNPTVQASLKQSTLPIPVQLTWISISAMVNLICGVALLKGKNWARFTYLTVGFLSFAMSLLTMHASMRLAALPGIVVFIILICFLFTPKANIYFKRAL